MNGTIWLLCACRQNLKCLRVKAEDETLLPREPRFMFIWIPASPAKSFIVMNRILSAMREESSLKSHNESKMDKKEYSGLLSRTHISPSSKLPAHPPGDAALHTIFVALCKCPGDTDCKPTDMPTNFVCFFRGTHLWSYCLQRNVR